MKSILRTLAMIGALALAAGCSTSGGVPSVSLVDATEDGLAEIAFPAPNPNLRVLRSAYVLGAVALYGAHAVEVYGGTGKDGAAAAFLFRVRAVAAELEEQRARVKGGHWRHLTAALYSIDVLELAEDAVAPVYRALRAQIIGFAAAPNPLAIARTAGGAIRQIARVSFVKDALQLDAREHAAEVGTRRLTDADWERALEPLGIACAKLKRMTGEASAPSSATC